MLVDVDVKWVKKLEPSAPVVKDALRYKDHGRYKLDLRMLTDAEQDKLVSIATELKGIGYKALATNLNTFRTMKADPGGTEIKSLQSLEAALIETLMKSPRHWLFQRSGDHRFPYYVTSIKWEPQRSEDGHIRPAFTMLSMSSQDDSTSLTWHNYDIAEGGYKTVGKLLAMKGCKVENDVLTSDYELELQKWHKVTADVGKQYGASGTGHVVSHSWYSAEDASLEKDGMRSKVVIDTEDADEGEEESSWGGSKRRKKYSGNNSNRKTADTKFWQMKGDSKLAGRTLVDRRGNYSKVGSSWDDDDEVEAEADAGIVALPAHCWVRAFDLATHQYMNVHVNDLEPWVFDDALATKLVLPADTLIVLEALVTGADKVMEDIVKGKTGGTIVVCTGDPGVGKTLSAEVFAEKMHKPLYTVQCSQLGLNPEQLEKQLGVVLARANRWGCILLIDEADVYVRARGEDIEQNAMVGVWLRVLEYYRGVMFLTSNKATMIDDAVMSRATAWIKYPRPTKTELERIWAVLLAQYEMETPTSLIAKLVETWPHLTGRNVKNMIKLAKQLADSSFGDKDEWAVYETASRFLDIDRTKGKPPLP